MSVETPNFFQFPNEIVDIYLPQMAGSEVMVFLYIIRKTLGFGDNKRLFSTRTIAQDTGLSKNTVTAALSCLKEKDLVGGYGAGIGGLEGTYYFVKWDKQPRRGVQKLQDRPKKK